MLSLKIIEYIEVIMAFQLSFFALFLFSHKPRQLHKFYLASFLAAKALVYLFTAYVILFHKHRVLFDVAFCFMLLLNPITFLYTKSLIEKNHRFRLFTLLHSLPFVFVLSSTIVKIVLKESFNKERFFILLLVFLVQVLVYVPKSIVLTIKKQKQKEKSEQEQIKLSWLNTLLYGLLLLWLVYGASAILQYVYKLNSYGLIIFIELFFLIILLGLIYVAIYNGKLFQFDLRKNKYHYSNLTNLQKIDLLQKLEQQISINQIFLDATLTLDKLANTMNISPRELSQIINEKKAKNFNEYINSFRLEYSMKLLVEDKEVSIQEILFQSGFNSSSVFYALFFKHTGKTPKQFRELNS